MSPLFSGSKNKPDSMKLDVKYSAVLLILKMEEICSSETSVDYTALYRRR
jgi:hypothetical protein